MNEVGPTLMTIYGFKGGEHVVRMRVTVHVDSRRSLDLTVTDRRSAEEWRSSYDSACSSGTSCEDIENLTQKTGNYKQFDVFVAMLQSGLLKTSECIHLDLLTLEDLELLRARRIEGNSCGSSGTGNNRRYLILTYTVEFDRIHYPLPLEYCGLPDPTVLQATVRRLRADIEKLQSTGASKELQRRVKQLTIENQRLIAENQCLSSGGKGLRTLLNSIKTLENNVAKERASFRVQIQKLKSENAALASRVRQLTELSGRKSGDGSPALRRQSPSSQTRLQNRRRSRSRSSSISRRVKTSSLSSGSSVESFNSRRSPCRNLKPRKLKDSKVDLGSLESRIHALQRMLKEGINLN